MSLAMEISREQEIIFSINQCLENGVVGEKDTQELVSLVKTHLFLVNEKYRKALTTYNLGKFFSSLTDEEITWEPEITATGSMEVSFSVILPSDFATDPARYVKNLHPHSVIPDYTEVTMDDTWIQYRASISSTDAVREKLRNSRYGIVSQ